ncbi:MAG: TolC family protein [Candidatus Gastranaerophilales bacterium]|nr:TolC family protein [Candidatus Gastranaerophilales bacterium]
MKKFIIFLIMISLCQTSAMAAFWNKDAQLGNEIKKEEYPESLDVEPKGEPQENKTLIVGGIEEIVDISMEECLRLALGNNPRIQAAMQDVFAADARIKQAWSSYFPQFSWQTGYSRIKQLQLSDALGENLIFNYFILGQVSASQMLYDFGVTQNQVTIRKLDKQGYETSLTGTVNDVICEVKKAYYAFQYALESKKVAEEMVARYEAFYNQAKAFYMAGTSPKVDVTIAEVNLSNAKLMLIQAENAVDIAMARLNNTMGLPYTNKYSISDHLKYDTCDITLSDAIDIAKESRPDYHLAELRVEEARQNVKLVKKSYFPTITVEGQYQLGGRTFVSNYGYNFGGYLNFPTINGMLIHSEIKEAKALYSKEQATAMSTKNDIFYQIQEAYYSMIEKKNSIPVSFLGLKQAKENYELSYGRYKVGVGNPVELKEAQVQYQDAMLRYYNSLYQFNSAKADLEKYIGKNLVDGEVELDLGGKKSKKKKKTS